MRKTRLAVFVFVTALHIVLFFFVSIEYQYRTVTVKVEPTAFKLVNITEAGPPKLQKSAALEKVSPPPYIPDTMKQEPAENFIEIEELPADESAINEHEETPADEFTLEQYALEEHEEKSGGGDAADSANDAALALEYVKRNFDYISRRVRSKLVYPPQARRTGVDGIVEVLFTLNIDGSVSGVSIKKSAGAEMLDEAAIAAIKSAAPFRAPPVSTRLLIPVVFSLRQ